MVNFWWIFIILFSHIQISLAETGIITTWGNDAMNKYCKNHAKCDPNNGPWLCSAQMVKADCPTKPGKDTNEQNKFKQICRFGEYGNGTIDNIFISPEDSHRCLTCSIPVCDTFDYPFVKIDCEKDICVKNANGKKSINTKQMDACPSNHQKNVAKCCMWGITKSKDYCSCVNIETLDVNKKTMDALGCNGKCENGQWDIGRKCNNKRKRKIRSHHKKRAAKKGESISYSKLIGLLFNF